MKVLYIPGILGSELQWQEGLAAPLHPLWPDLGAILRGEMAYLQLAADGLSPGPLAQGNRIVAPKIVGPCYGPLAQFMLLLGWDVLELPYDWRLSHITIAQQSWPLVKAWAAGQPIFIVAHSQGGLVARAIYGQMLAAGLDAQLARIVTIGTPQFGSLEPARMWWRLPYLYVGLLALTAGALTWPGGAGPSYLDAVIASHPSWYELTAFASFGPLAQQFPAQAAALYGLPFYFGGNPSLSANLMLSAQLVQAQLNGWVPPNRMVSIVGTGYRTAYALNQPGDPSQDSGWLYTQAGDGDVTVAAASLPGVPIYAIPVEHPLQPLHPSVWTLLPPLVINGHL